MKIEIKKSQSDFADLILNFIPNHLVGISIGGIAHEP
jgi:hypothetical protein